MAVRYRFDPGRSRFQVQAFATGLLSALGHSPTFSVDDFAGEIRFVGGEIQGLALELTVRADSLALEDQIRPADRDEIEGRMRRDVLETSAFREIHFRGAHLANEPVGPGRYRVRIGGQLTLHGVTRPDQVDTELLILENGLQLRGDSRLRLSDYQIKPVTALGGAIRLKDELRLSFEIAARVEET